ncbi:hypothetical protein Q3G72_033471 [Acer saccharum]|nr:hypothetical protein Q3G72_033471 [Acer saccharum]
MQYSVTYYQNAFSGVARARRVGGECEKRKGRARTRTDRSSSLSSSFTYKVRGVLGNTVATVTFHHGYRS